MKENEHLFKIEGYFLFFKKDKCLRRVDMKFTE